MNSILDVRNLNKKFASVVAAADINVSVASGERIGLIGTNGAGKTTFVNMVTGYIAPSSGSIVLEGKDITGLNPRLINRAGISRSFQIPQLFLSLTTEENLVAAFGIAKGYGSHLARGVDAELQAAVDGLLDRFKLSEYRTQAVSKLAGGVRKLLDIAVAVTRRPKILLMDEPTSGVASEQKFALMDIVMSAVGKDVTVLFVEHDMDIVAGYANRVLAFYDGKIIADGTPSTVLANDTVRTYITGGGAIT
jgi:branched-chain amino acid transport system ATP-binding protein